MLWSSVRAMGGWAVFRENLEAHVKKVLVSCPLKGTVNHESVFSSFIVTDKQLFSILHL